MTNGKSPTGDEAARPTVEDTIDRMADDAPMLPSVAVKHGRLDDTPESLVADYLKALPTLPKIGSVMADRWRIERLLGEGGFGAVFEGRDQQLGRKVAIKVMRGEGRAPTDALEMRAAITRMDERRRRFFDEARAVARAESPNVVTVYDVGEHGAEGDATRWPFLVLELVDGTPLDRVVRDRPTPEVGLHIIEQLVQGVATLHARRVVHRDLKPANAMLTADGRVKILDFGLAIAASDWTEVKGPRAPEDWIEGTPHYMSPEVTAGGDPDVHSDLWALAVMAYELMTGRSPWGEHLTQLELERRIAREDPAPLVPASTPEAQARWAAHLNPILWKMLAKRPADRYQSAAEVAQAFADLRSQTTPSGTRESREPHETGQPFRYLLAFEEKDAGWFFGREEITQKLTLALEQRGRLVIAGPSGAGKTSLVQAGLIPELKILRPLEVLRMQPGREPLARLAALVSGLTGSDAAVTADDVRQKPGLVGERLRQHTKTTKKRVLVQVDALEEVITEEASAADVEIFGLALEGLRDDATRNVLLVMAVRDEYLGRLPRLSRALESALRDAEFLGPPTRAAMLMALVRPVKRMGYTWQEGFPEEMVDAVTGQASPLPVLQLAASWVWEKRSPASTVLGRSLLASEGEALRIGDVLGQYADHKLRAASWSEADRELVKRMLPVMVSAEGTPLIVPIEDILGRVAPALRGRAQELLRDLTDFRLLTSLRDERARECLTPVHTTLIRGWALLREALEGSAELEAFLRRFERDARDWEAARRDPAKLWPDAALRDFERWAPRLGDVQLAPTQLAFRAAVAQQARRARTLRWGLAAVLVALAIGGTWAGFAFSAQAEQAEALRQEALSQKALAEQQTDVAKKQTLVAEEQTAASVAHRREADGLIDYMLGDLRQRLEPIGQVKVLRAVAERARDYLDARQGGRLDNTEDAARRATVLRNLAAVFGEEGDTTAAEKALRDALAISGHIAEAQPDDDLAQRNHAVGLTNLAGVLNARGDPAAALDSYKSAFLIYDKLLQKNPTQVTAQRDIELINDRLGDIFVSLGKLDAAIAVQRTAVSIAQRLAAAMPDDPLAQRDLAVAENKVGTSLAAQGDIAGARASREKLLALVTKLAASDPDSAQAQRDLAIGHSLLADILSTQGDAAGALEHNRSALAIDEALARQDPSSANAARDLAISHNKVGDILIAQGELAAAAKAYDASLAIVLRLATADPANVRIQQDLAQSWRRVGTAKQGLGDDAAGISAIAKAADISGELADVIGTEQSRIDLAHTLLFYAQAFEKAGDKVHAREQVIRARELLAPILTKPDAPYTVKALDKWLSEIAPE